MERDCVAPKRKAKIPIPAAPKKTGIFVKLQGISEFLPKSYRISEPHFRKKKDLIKNLNSFNDKSVII